METKIKRTIAILLLVCFLVSLRATSISASNGDKIKNSNPDSGVKVTADKEKRDKPEKGSYDTYGVTVIWFKYS